MRKRQREEGILQGLVNHIKKGHALVSFPGCVQCCYLGRTWNPSTRTFTVVVVTLIGLLWLRPEPTHKQVIRHISCPEEVLVRARMHMSGQGWKEEWRSDKPGSHPAHGGGTGRGEGIPVALLMLVHSYNLHHFNGKTPQLKEYLASELLGSRWWV